MKRGKNIFYLIYKIFYGPIKTLALHLNSFVNLWMKQHMIAVTRD